MRDARPIVHAAPGARVRCPACAGPSHHCRTGPPGCQHCDTIDTCGIGFRVIRRPVFKAAKVAKVPTPLTWEFNASTGAYIARVDDAVRLLRYGQPGAYYYHAEWWGDYSRTFPIGTTALTIREALADLAALRAKLPTGRP